MRTNIKLLSLCFAVFGLGGCATSYLHYETGVYSPKYDRGIALEDTLIAIGHSRQPIKNYENALILAGEKYSYLAIPNQKKKVPQNLFQQIYTQVDLKYLIAGQFKYERMIDENTARYDLKPKLGFRLEHGKSAKNQKLLGEIGFLFNKPMNLLKSGERENLEAMGFKCNLIEKNLKCTLDSSIELHLASAAKNQSELKYTFKRPVQLVVGYEIEKFDYKGVGRIALYPLAIAVDIVTSPIQLVGVVALASAMSP